MALKDLYSKYYYDQNYNCAETMIRAGNEYYGLELHDRDMIAFGGFGAGIQTGNTCGAILSAVSILSMRYVEKKAHESTDIRCKHTIEAACDILEQVIEEYDSPERSMP
ncbi:MAG: C-GCAxxG-C-C family protein [Lachnospiraceae bacterium]|nr:C-GCAxxG-C-C family protein [Lachnospiraceae bacterium]